MTILVTGGAGFIGANFVLDWLHTLDEPVVNLDKLTYAGNLENLASLWHDPRHQFVRGDIGDDALVRRLLAEHKPRADGMSYATQIRFVSDRRGHDRRYAINASRMERELDWCPAETFDSGIRKTVRWYLENQTWVQHVTNGEYLDWMKRQYSA